MNSEFLPEGYEAPQGTGNYMKLQSGENKFRILSKPIIGWLDWKDNKPHRFRMKERPEKPMVCGVAQETLYRLHPRCWILDTGLGRVDTWTFIFTMNKLRQWRIHALQK